MLKVHTSEMVWWFFGKQRFLQSCKCHTGFFYLQKFSLVNVKLKWVKDKTLDSSMVCQTDLRATSFLISIISADPRDYVPIYYLSRYRRQLGFPDFIKVSTFLRRYPNIFKESSFLDTGGTHVPLFCLTSEARDLHRKELNIFQENRMDIINRLCKLLMLTRDRCLPLQVIDQLKWDIGLPFNYINTLLPLYPQLLSVVQFSDDREGLKLLSWDVDLAVSHLENYVALQGSKEGVNDGCLAFPIGFTPGFGLKKKCVNWLEEWQRLPYTSPYNNASHLDPRTDASEKRIVGVFHELLHLTLQKKTERKNVSNLRKPLCLPQKFTKVFERHPGIFYISKKCDTQTIVLREAYDGYQLREKHPLVEIRETYALMMKEGFLDRSRGLYR